MIRFVPPFKTRYIASISGGVTGNIANIASIGVAIGATCAATVVHDASASASVSVNAQAKGHFTYFAIADITISATAAGQRTAQGTANIGVDITASADATTFTAHSGTADVSVAINTTASAATTTPIEGTADVSVSIGATASATTVTPIEGAATCAVTITASADGLVEIIRYGAATCEVTINASAHLIKAFTNNYSLDFGAVSHYVQLTDDDSIFDFGTNAFTMTVWFKVDSFPHTHTRLISGHDGSDGDSFVMYANGTTGFGIYGAGNTYVDAGSANVSTGTWYNGTVTRSGTTVTVYLDGQQVAQNTSISGSYVVDSSEGTHLGRDPDGHVVYGFSGHMSHVGVWNEALTSSEVSAIYNSGNPLDLLTDSGNYSSSSGLQGYWRLEEGSGTSTADATGNSDDATISGASWSTDVPETTTHSGTASCQVNLSASASGTLLEAWSNDYSISLDGEDTYLSIGNPSDLQITGNMTISAWFKTSSGSNNRIIDKDGGGGQPRSYILLLVSNKLRWVRFNSAGTGYTIDTVDTYNDNAWHHVVVTNKTSGTIDIYVDGTALTLGTGTGNYTNVTSSGNSGITMNNAAVGINMGYFAATTSQYFDGLIDEVAIWDDVLTSSEVTAIYNNGAPTDLTTDAGNYASSANLQGHWRMEEGSGTSVADSSSNSNAATLNNSPTFSTTVPS